MSTGSNKLQQVVKCKQELSLPCAFDGFWRAISRLRDTKLLRSLGKLGYSVDHSPDRPSAETTWTRSRQVGHLTIEGQERHCEKLGTAGRDGWLTKYPLSSTAAAQIPSRVFRSAVAAVGGRRKPIARGSYVC